MEGRSRWKWALAVLGAALLAALGAALVLRPETAFPRIEAFLAGAPKPAPSAPPSGPAGGAAEDAAQTPGEQADSTAASTETPAPGDPADEEAPGTPPRAEVPALSAQPAPGSGPGYSEAGGGALEAGAKAPAKPPAQPPGGTGPSAARPKPGPPRGGGSSKPSGESPEGDAQGKALSDINRLLSGAGFSRGPSGTGPALFAKFPGAKGGLLFDANRIAAAGGRTGQGQVSMDRNNAATLENFDLSAKGLKTSKGKEPPGPKIPAGKAPALPSAHLPYILQAAEQTGVDPALIAATAARESNFRYGAYRAEPHLKSVPWREAPGKPQQKHFDGSLGPMQVLRSNFLARGIDNDLQANDLATNYRVGAQIIRGDISAFPNNAWKSVAAYNVGVYGAKIGRVPANNYADTILSWRKDYDKAIAPYR